MNGVGVGAHQLGQIRPEVGDVRGVTLLGHHCAAQLQELVNSGPANSFGIIGELRDRRQRAYTVGPHDVAGFKTPLLVAHGRAEDVVAGIGDVGIGGQTGEEDHAVGFGQRSGAEHGAAARGAEDYFDAVNVGQLVVGRDGVLGGALRILHDEFEHTAVDTAGGVDLVSCHLLGLDGNGAVGLTWAGERFHDADPKRLVRSRHCNGGLLHHGSGRLRRRSEGRAVVAPAGDGREDRKSRDGDRNDPVL